MRRILSAVPVSALVRQFAPGAAPFFVACLAIGLPVGCVSTPTSGLERMGNAISKGEMSVDDALITLESRGRIDFEIESFGGSIRIEAVPGMSGTTIEPVRRAYHGHLRRDEGAEALDQIEYRVEIKGGELDRETVSITTSTSHAEDHFQGVDFHIRTGDLGAVQVSTERGRVWVKNNTGPVDIETTYGDIRVLTDHPMEEAMVMITKDASIDYRVPPGSTGYYDLRSVGGRVYQRFTNARVTATSEENGPSIFMGRIGGGEAPVVLRTTYGDIRVAVVEEPNGVGPIISE